MLLWINPSRPRRGLRAGLSALLLLAASGCGGRATIVPAVDTERARQVLREALDAWKTGKPHDSLASQSPPIRVADEDWLAGFRLMSYETSPKDQLVGDALRCPVALSMKDKAGKNVKKRVVYNVATAPSPSVIRQD